MTTNIDGTMPSLDAGQKCRLTTFLLELVDQSAARILVRPYRDSPGFWFGGGNLLLGSDGNIYLVGRFRNAGDSRTGVGRGERGLELAIFASTDGGDSFSKVRSWSKPDLSYADNNVVSIEGAALNRRPGGDVELYISTEKAKPYPQEIAEYQKPGTGVWSIDMISAASVNTLDVTSIRPILAEVDDPAYLHVKDPVILTAEDGATVLLYCNHPFTWSSANTGYAIRRQGSETFRLASREMVSRGPAWDVAGTRITDRMRIPQLGAFRGAPPVSVYFYDGLECYLRHDQHARAVSRPRGWSCEEIAGALYGFDSTFPCMTRLSLNAPLFVSPTGTGCCRYIHTLVTDLGILATWQQSQEDQSQPLVGRFLPMNRVEELLR